MRVLITGINGFVGSYLASTLIEKGDEVFGTTRPGSPTEGLKKIQDKLGLEECELLDAQAVKKVVAKVKPDYIYHLAAIVQTYGFPPREVYETNILAQLNLLEAVRELNLKSRILLVGTFREYGQIKAGESPIKEDFPLKPIQSYGASKAAQGLMGYQYFKEFGLDIVRTRSFNHAGAGRTQAFVEGSFAKQIAEIEAGISEPLMLVGNLKSKGDFSHVKDVCDAYILLMEKGVSGEVYNVGSGIPHSIQEILDTLLSFTNIKVEVKEDSARFRPTEEFWADVTKIKNLGWQAKYSFEEMLKETFVYWQEFVKKSK